MSIKKIQAGRINTITANAYVGEYGTIFYNEALGDLRLSDGVTLGGVPLNVGSGGSGNGVVYWTNIIGTPTFANVAYTGSYNDLIDLPSIYSTGALIEGGASSTVFNILGLNLDGGTISTVYIPEDIFIDGGGA